jgi:hypothetical protein
MELPHIEEVIQNAWWESTAYLTRGNCQKQATEYFLVGADCSAAKSDRLKEAGPLSQTALTQKSENKLTINYL